MNDPASEPIVETLHGEFSQRWGEYSELSGKGSITVGDEGLHIIALRAPLRRRSWLLLATFFASAIAALYGASLDGGIASAFAALFITLGGGITLAMLTTRRRPFDQVIPWRMVQRAGISENALTFQLPRLDRDLSKARRNARVANFVRFAVPGYELKELRPLASQLVRRASES